MLDPALIDGLCKLAALDPSPALRATLARDLELLTGFFAELEVIPDCAVCATAIASTTADWRADLVEPTSAEALLALAPENAEQHVLVPRVLE